MLIQCQTANPRRLDPAPRQTYRYPMRVPSFPSLALITIAAILPNWIPSASGQTPPEIFNGSFDDGDAIPDGWVLWEGEGEISLGRDTAELAPATEGSADEDPNVASLVLRPAESGGYGNAAQRIEPSGGAFVVKASAKLAEGEVEECQIALQVFDTANPPQQIDWIVVGDPLAGGGWQDFSRRVELSEDAGFANILVVLRGEGATVHLDNLEITEAE